MRCGCSSELFPRRSSSRLVLCGCLGSSSIFAGCVECLVVLSNVSARLACLHGRGGGRLLEHSPAAAYRCSLLDDPQATPPLQITLLSDGYLRPPFRVPCIQPASHPSWSATDEVAPDQCIPVDLSSDGYHHQRPQWV